jgi:site-specific DNA recombinase
MPDQPSPADRVVVVYERVSSDKQDIARQETVREWAREMFPNREIVVVQDDGVSAFKVPIFDRPGGKQLCEMIEADRVEAVCADAQDRLSRGDDLEWVTFRTLCEAHDARLVIDGREIRNDLGGRVETYLKALLAREESREKAHRVKGGLLKTARSGRRPCGAPPPGYRVEYRPVSGTKEQQGYLVVDEAGAELVRRVFSEYVSGLGVNMITRGLNKEDVRTRRGARFSTRVISTVLSNPIYIGRFRLNGETFEGEHEAIIDLATWQQVQTLRASRQNAPGKGRGRPPTGRHLFVGGLLRCGLCGCSMSPRRKPNGSEFYRCTKHHAYGPEACPMPDINRRRVDEQTLAEFETSLVDVEGSIATVRSEGRRRVEEAFALAEIAEREAAKIEEWLGRIDADYRSGEISGASWERKTAELTEDRAAALAEAERHRAHAEALGADVLALDADAEFQRTVVELREAVAGRIETADGLGALRAALAGTFERVVLHRQDGAVYLLPYLRAEAIHPSALDPSSEAWDPHVAQARQIPLQIATNDKEDKTPESED